MFHQRWIRNVVALSAVLLVISFCFWAYMAAVSRGNQKRIESYRHQLGADSAGELYALSIEQRDPQLFELRDVGLLSDFQFIVDQEIEVRSNSEREGGYTLTTNQLQEMLLQMRNSPQKQAPEIVDLTNPNMINSYRICVSLVGACCQSQGTSSGTLTGEQTLLAMKADQERWMIGVELIESVYSGGLLLDEMCRLSLLDLLLNRCIELISSADPDFLEQAAAILARIKMPTDGLVRALQIESLIVLDQIESGGLPFTGPFDLRYYLDRQIPIYLDPFGATMPGLGEPPFYAVLSRLTWRINHEGTIAISRRAGARLRAVRGAVDATAARIRGEEWIPPAGVELLDSPGGVAPRIHIIGGPEEADVFLPR
ncbi:MAG: hypothetical protein OSB09_01725 [Planctomycetota bacterium]|nr:hypothetical protein [Planctomycetota bacterium]